MVTFSREHRSSSFAGDKGYSDRWYGVGVRICERASGTVGGSAAVCMFAKRDAHERAPLYNLVQDWCRLRFIGAWNICSVSFLTF